MHSEIKNRIAQSRQIYERKITFDKSVRVFKVGTWRTDKGDADDVMYLFFEKVFEKRLSVRVQDFGVNILARSEE